MFTGIITATTPVKHVERLDGGLKITFQTPKGWNDLVLGESIAINGACLTVAELGDSTFTMFLMPETLDKTSFKNKVPEVVNLERALALGDRLGGHMVQGHVDGVGKVTSVDATDGYTIEVKFPAENEPFVIHKGSITIDGVSLTVASCKDNSLRVALIPHTLAHTTLGRLQAGDAVNLEFDLLGKYIAKMLKR